jgi:hypothetical protein
VNVDPISKTSRSNNTTAYGDGKNNILSPYINANWFFDTYDAYFNGSFTITLSPPANTPSCQKTTSQLITNAYFRIGQLEIPTNLTFSRKKYDDNPFYFRFGRNQIGSRFACPTTPNKAFIGFESSNSNLEDHGVWKLNSTKANDGFNISGRVTTVKANYNNHFNYLPTKAEQKPGCPSHFQAFTLTEAYNVSMNGTVTASLAKISWSFVDVRTMWTVQGTFTGVWWDQGAKLVVSQKDIVTTGQAKRILPKKVSFWSKWGSIVIYSVIGGLVSLRSYLMLQLQSDYPTGFHRNTYWVFLCMLV